MDIKNAEKAEKSINEAVAALMELNASDNPAVSFIAMEIIPELVKFERKVERFKEVIKQLEND